MAQLMRHFVTDSAGYYNHNIFETVDGYILETGRQYSLHYEKMSDHNRWREHVVLTAVGEQYVLLKIAACNDSRHMDKEIALHKNIFKEEYAT
jgi:hypothetical protein